MTDPCTDAPSGPPAPSYQDLLDDDTRPVPDSLRLTNPYPAGRNRVATAYYTSVEYHELEKERLWKRTWQFACREEHVAEPGDVHVYEIAGMSMLVVRTSRGELKGYWNTCLHRGRALRDEGGRVPGEIVCGFHGFTWDLDGELVRLPAPWDFPGTDPAKLCLPEVRVGTWGGFVFVNPDPAAEPLEDFLGVLPEQFAPWRFEDRYVEAHVAKVVRANWKIVQEAFSEAFHVIATHPQLLTSIGDLNTQYDVWGNVSRAVTPLGTPSPHLSWEPTQAELMASMLDRPVESILAEELPEGVSARAAVGELARAALRDVIGDQAEKLSDAELVDSLDYSVYPNFHPWGAYNRLVYRFRPNGDDHTTSIMEAIFLSPVMGDRPPPAPVHWLDDDARWIDAPALGRLGRVFDQDELNMPRVQDGLTSGPLDHLTLSTYQESKLRQFYDLYERDLGLRADVEG